MNKSNIFFFYFHSNHYFNKVISPYLFNYKKLTIFLKLYLFLNKKTFLIYFTKNGVLQGVLDACYIRSIS